MDKKTIGLVIILTFIGITTILAGGNANIVYHGCESDTINLEPINGNFTVGVWTSDNPELSIENPESPSLLLSKFSWYLLIKIYARYFRYWVTPKIMV